METKHTPGPWHMGDGNGVGCIFGPEGLRVACKASQTTIAPICMMVESFGGVSHRHIYTYAEDEANARLIAAAPETARQRDMLLETCQLVSLHCVGSVNLQDIELSVQHGPLGATGKGKATLREVLEAAIAATEKGV